MAGASNAEPGADKGWSPPLNAGAGPWRSHTVLDVGAVAQAVGRPAEATQATGDGRQQGRQDAPDTDQQEADGRTERVNDRTEREQPEWSRRQRQ